MAETCYYKGTKVILLPGRNAHGKWECQFTIPDLRASAADTYEGRSPKEYETEQEAEAAAFECSKKVLDSSNQSTEKQSASAGVFKAGRDGVRQERERLTGERKE